MYVLLLYLYVHSAYYVCTLYVQVHTFFLFSKPSFTGFRGVLRDANMPVPDAQQPPADLDIDRDDPCPEDEECFDRPDAATMEEAISRFMDGLCGNGCVHALKQWWLIPQ